MTWQVRFTEEAELDLIRLYEFILKRDTTDWSLAEAALESIRAAITTTLEQTPYICRKASTDSPFLRELIIPFGATGYIALFEIEDAESVTILAIRHQRESGYH